MMHPHSSLLRHTRLSRITLLLVGLVFGLSGSLTRAEPAAPATTDPPENKIAPESEVSIQAKETQPVVQKISPTTYKIGQITFNKETREITIPAQTNITNPDTVLEYLLVHLNGEKVHEALLVTEADPTHINIALKLLNYKESNELFRELKPDGTPGENYHVVADEIKQAARFGVYLSWKANDKPDAEQKNAPITHWLRNRLTQKPMPNTPWVYNGSYIHNKKFKAKLNGNILTILPDSSAIANYPGEDRDDDTLWFPAPRIPTEGSAVTVTLKPWKK